MAFDKPAEFSSVDMVFPTTVRGYLPEYATLPEEFKRPNKWESVISTWFYEGLKGATFVPRDGINKTDALKHIGYCLGSWEPKHEHKMAGCAYLLSKWFERVELAQAA